MMNTVPIIIGLLLISYEACLGVCDTSTSLNASVGSEIVLVCPTNGSKPVDWKYRPSTNENIQGDLYIYIGHTKIRSVDWPHHNRTVLVQKGGYVDLQIRDVGFNDTGIYTCIEETVDSDIRHDIYLSVYFPVSDDFLSTSEPISSGAAAAGVAVAVVLAVCILIAISVVVLRRRKNRHSLASSEETQNLQENKQQQQPGIEMRVLESRNGDGRPTSSSSEQPPPDGRVRTVKYEEIEVLMRMPEGTFGNIFHGRHPEFGNVVYKELESELQSDRRCKGKMTDDVAALITLLHANIVKILAMVSEAGHFGVLYEFAMYRGLDAFVNKINYKVGWFCRMSFAGDIARGLAYLHGVQPPVLHRDIKMQNVVIDKLLVAKICDFGMSEWIKYSTAKTGNLPGTGTVAQVPPEILTNINAKRTVECDIYSFAMLLWELFSDKKPFETDLTNAVLISVVVRDGQRPEVDAIRGIEDPRMPDSMFHLLERYVALCWAPDPANRPQTAVVSKEFDAFLNENIDAVTDEKSELEQRLTELHVTTNNIVLD